MTTDEKQKIEAALFMSHKPLSVEEISKIVGRGAADVEKMLLDMQQEYAGRGMEVMQTPEGWCMRVKNEFADDVAHLTPHADLAEGVLKSLALIVYKQPVKQSYLVKVQGNKVYNYIKMLEQKGLVKAEKKMRTKMISTTPSFESYFGINAEELRKNIEEQLSSKSKAAKRKEKENAQNVTSATKDETTQTQ